MFDSIRGPHGWLHFVIMFRSIQIPRGVGDLAQIHQIWLRSLGVCAPDLVQITRGIAQICVGPDFVNRIWL